MLNGRHGQSTSSKCSGSVLEPAEKTIDRQNGRNENSESWREELKKAERRVDKLIQRLALPTELLPAARQAAARFPLLVPCSFLDRISRGDLQDPLLRQVLPTAAELENREGFRADPVGDLQAVRAPGLLQKYPGRALLVATSCCGVHCRFCFRRAFPFSDQTVQPDRIEQAVAVIRQDSELQEVILSGGDPLTLPSSQLQEMLEQLNSVSHLRRLRIHTRLPIVIPACVTERLLKVLNSFSRRVVVVVHCNHPNELNAECETALRRLVQAGLVVLNQTVLLKGVNDDADTLSELCERLVDLGVLPYYLHQLDRVSGAAHFEVPELEGKRLLQELRERLPGYCVPKYVREVPGKRYKVPLA